MSAAAQDVALGAASWQGVDANVQALVDRWLVREGERVAEGQPVVRVVLVKSSIDVTAPAAGVIDRIAVQAGETFGRGQALATLRPA